MPQRYRTFLEINKNFKKFSRFCVLKNVKLLIFNNVFLMEKINLSETEKKVLRALSISHYEEGMLSDLSREELYVSSNRLKQYGLITAHFAEGDILAAAMILAEGIVYLKENPTLENPADDNELKRLQIDDLEHKKRIRKMENVIMIWKFICAIMGLTALLGWLLYLFKIR
jgi:hypothetical protein